MIVVEFMARRQFLKFLIAAVAGLWAILVEKNPARVTNADYYGRGRYGAGTYGKALPASGK